MASTALDKKKEPVIPTERAELAGAITGCKQAEARRDGLRNDIGRGKRSSADTDEEIKGLEAKVAAADAADRKRAAGMIKAGRPVVTPWTGDTARSAIEHAKVRRDSIMRGVAELESELAEAEIDAASAKNAVVVSAIKLVAPLFAARMARIRELRSELLQERVALSMLMSDTPVEFPQGAEAFFPARAAETARIEARKAACGAFAREAETDGAYLAVMPAAHTTEEYSAVIEAADRWKRAFARLLDDPAAELPEKI
jgi:hypothetical protein